MTIENNGNGTFGDLYMNGKMNGGANTKVTINEARATARGYGNGNSKLLTPQHRWSLSILEINTTTAGRGLNAGNNAADTVNTERGKLLIKANGGLANSGIRRAKVTE